MKKQEVKLYMITLNGQGDTDIKFVEKDVWDWIEDLQTKGWKTPPPESVLAKLKEKYEEYDPEEATLFDEPVTVTAYSRGYGPVHITSGSGDNDAAIQVPAAIVKGAKGQFWSMKEALEFIKEYNINVVDTYEGMIY
jgi:hypothetical protein